MGLFGRRRVDPLAEVEADAPRFCLGCEYDLHGLKEPRCPECGRRFDPRDSDTFARESARIRSRRWLRPVLIWMCALVPVELCCAAVAYHTIGEVACAGLIVVTVVGNGIVWATLLTRRPRFAGVLVAIIALIVIPDQVRLGVLLLTLDSEARSIVQYLEKTKQDTGGYPPSLGGYNYRFPSSQKHIQTYQISPRDGGYIFHWYIGSPTASHWYSPRSGWGYYPD